jgi:pyruvate dehydrogenase (quinone)
VVPEKLTARSHLFNGSHDAKGDHQPVVAIVRSDGMAGQGRRFQQEVDLTSLFKDPASEFVHMALVPEQTRHLVDRGLRIAKAERTGTCIIMANNPQE